MTVNVISPTAITNSIPRPKSPRRPDYRGFGVRSRDPHGGATTPTGTNQSKNHGTGVNPKIGRRPHEAMGRFATHRSDPELEPRLCVAMDMKDLMSMANKQNPSACVSMSVDKSKEYAVRYGPAAKENLVECGAVTADGMAEVAGVAADFYRQECKTDNRGDDTMFFVNPQENSKETNSLVDTVSSEENKTPSKEHPSDRAKVEQQRDDSKQPFRSPRSMRFPEAIHIMKDPAAEMDMSPPRVDRVTDSSKVWPDVIQQPRSPFGQKDHTNLRNARLQLFQNDNGGVSEEQARLARALEDLNRQDKLIGRLQKQLRQTTEVLETTNKELKETREVAQRRQFTATEVRARAVQERKKMEETLEKESQTNRKLQGVISQLQVETSGLKLALRNARNDGARRARLGDAPDRAPTPETPAPQFIAMRAEIVDLRSQLAEARAAKLEDNSSLHRFGELEQLKVKLKEVQTELQGLKEKDLNVQKQTHMYSQSEKVLRDKLLRTDRSSKESTQKLQEKLKEVMESESTVKAELVKCKANLHRLERERSQGRLKLASEADRGNKQVSQLNRDIAKLSKQLADEQTTSKSEIQALKTEVSTLKQKLTSGNQETIVKTTEFEKERRKLQKDMAGQNQEIKALQTKISSQDSKIVELECRMAASQQHSTDRSTTAVQQLKEEIHVRKANEAKLQADIQIHKNLLQHSKENARKWQALGAQADQEKEATYQREIAQLKKEVAKLQEVNASGEAAATLASAAVSEANLLFEIDTLKQKVSDLQKFKESASATDNAKEQAYLNDICLLKASLSEAQDKCKEEKFRAEEERRISREMEAKRVAEIDLLQQEKDNIAKNEARLVTELRDLKSKIVISLSPTGETDPNSLAASRSQESNGDEKAGGDRDLGLPENVTRLRKELALARARLAAAREVSRPYTAPGSPDDKSVTSTSGFSWIPHFTKESPVDLDDATLPPMSSMSNESNSATPLPGTTRDIEPLILEENEPPSDEEEANSDVDVSDLQRQLRESSKRLLDANSKLKGLVRASDEFMGGHQQILGNTTLLTLVRLNSDDESVDSSRIDELRASPSGNIEVSERRFCDI
jgi:hypothetical protein